MIIETRALKKTCLVWIVVLAGLGSLPRPAEARPPEKVATADLTGTVVKVMDGETVQVQLKDQHKPIIIRLIGLEAPAKASREKDGQEPWGTRAQQYLSLLLTRNAVRVEFDVLVPVSSDNTQRLGLHLAGQAAGQRGHALLGQCRPGHARSQRQVCRTLEGGSEASPRQTARPLEPEGTVARIAERVPC